MKFELLVRLERGRVLKAVLIMDCLYLDSGNEL
jgi:hypothetical protein